MKNNQITDYIILAMERVGIMDDLINDVLEELEKDMTQEDLKKTRMEFEARINTKKMRELEKWEQESRITQGLVSKDSPTFRECKRCEKNYYGNNDYCRDCGDEIYGA